MQGFRNLKTSTKLYSIVGLMSVVMIVVGCIGLFLAKTSNDGLDTVYKDRVVCLQQLKVISDMYAVNIVDTSHKVRDGALSWSDGIKNLAESRKRTADEWKDYTGLPFVFACWTANKIIPKDFRDEFNMALKLGVNNIDKVVEKFGETGAIHGEILKKYLTENIDYCLDEKKKKGLELFLELLKKL